MGTDLRDLGGDVFHIWTSPVRARRTEWARVGLAGVAFAGTALFDERIDRWIVRHPKSPPLRALEPVRADSRTHLVELGTRKGLLPLTGALYAAGLVTDATGHRALGRGLRDAGLGCAAAQQSITYFRHVTYVVLARTRPREANGDAFDIDVPGGGVSRHSFLGGHAAHAVACAAFVSRRFELGPAEPVLFAVAGGIALGRMADRRHWASDTMLGTVFGYAVGRTIAHRSLVRRGKR